MINPSTRSCAAQSAVSANPQRHSAIRHDRIITRVLFVSALFLALAGPLVYMNGSRAALKGKEGRVRSAVATEDGLGQPLKPVRAAGSATKSLSSVAAPLLAGDLYVDTGSGCGGNSPCFTAIQAAINAATAGDTIHVSAGTYAEQININKPLSLLGPNANIDPNTATRGAEAIILPTTTDQL